MKSSDKCFVAELFIVGLFFVGIGFGCSVRFDSNPSSTKIVSREISLKVYLLVCNIDVCFQRHYDSDLLKDK